MAGRKVAVREVLYNLHPSSGASEDYAKGVFVGTVATLSSYMSFQAALKKATDALPAVFMTGAIPEPWKEDVMAILKKKYKR